MKIIWNFFVSNRVEIIYDLEPRVTFVFVMKWVIFQSNIQIAFQYSLSWLLVTLTLTSHTQSQAQNRSAEGKLSSYKWQKIQKQKGDLEFLA